MTWDEILSEAHTTTIQMLEQNKAIEALEKEPCEDAISRSEAIRVSSGYCHYTNIPKELAKLPSVQPEKKTNWIPVSKESPKESGKYLVTFGGMYPTTGKDFYLTEEDAIRIFGEYEETEEDARKFLIDARKVLTKEPKEYDGWRSQNVIAWMPLPEPYKESEEYHGNNTK